MPTYFFNLHKGDQLLIDDVGSDLPDAQAARQEAVTTIAEIAKDDIPADGDHLVLSIDVTDTNGNQVLSVKVAFDAEPEEGALTLSQ